MKSKSMRERLEYRKSQAPSKNGFKKPGSNKKPYPRKKGR